MRTPVAVVAAVLIAAAGLGGGLAWAFLDRGPAVARTASPSVRALLGAPQRFYGRRVTLTGSVDAIYNRHAFTLGPPLQPGLLVTVRDIPLLQRVKPDAVVRVTGVARRFAVPQWQAWTGGTSDLATLATYDGKPVVRAARVERIGAAGATVTSPARPNATTRP